MYSSIEEEVTSGEVKLSLKYGSIPIVDETLDFCDLVTQINKQCPLKKGPLKIDFAKQQLPDYIPSVSCTKFISILSKIIYAINFVT